MTVSASDHCPKCNHSALFHSHGRCFIVGCNCKETRESIKLALKHRPDLVPAATRERD